VERAELSGRRTDAELTRVVAAAYPGLLAGLRRRIGGGLGRELGAEDVLQESLLVALDHFGERVPSRGELASYVSVVARRRLVDAARRRVGTVPDELVGDLSDPEPAVEERGTAREEVGSTHGALRRLPRAQAWAAFLHQLGARWDAIQLLLESESEHAARCKLTRARSRLMEAASGRRR
jgi:DNA-directed RNA polymerase specialized sigma24 family protein